MGTVMVLGPGDKHMEQEGGAVGLGLTRPG
jgi:hypothetical protein